MVDLRAKRVATLNTTGTEPWGGKKQAAASSDKGRLNGPCISTVVVKAFIGHGPHETEHSRRGAELRIATHHSARCATSTSVATIVCHHDCAVLKRTRSV
jgi:hypothetical protein